MILRTVDGRYYDTERPNGDGTFAEVDAPETTPLPDVIHARLRCLELAATLPDAHSTASVLANAKTLADWAVSS